MKNKSYLLVLLIVIFGQLFNATAQNSLPKSVFPSLLTQSNLPSQFEKKFTGTIGSNIKIRMSLKREGKSLKGTYNYEKIGTPLRIEGTIDGQKVVINEFDASNNTTGNFVGQFAANGSFTGIWTRGRDGKTFPFSLAESDSGSNDVGKGTALKCSVKTDSGELEMGLQGDKITSFSYTNVGGGGHTCTIEASRDDGETNWQDKDTNTTIDFKEEEVKVLIEKETNQYTISFLGDDEKKRYFCGVRSVLPDKLQIVKTANGYSGKKIK